MSEIEKHKHDEDQDDPIPFWPDHALNEIYVALGVVLILVIIGVLGQMNPVGLEEPADTLNTPEHAKSEWYFLFLYQFLKYVPKTFGVITPFVGIFLLLIWPFLDRRKEDSLQGRRYRLIGVAVFLIVAGILTYLGASS